MKTSMTILALTLSTAVFSAQAPSSAFTEAYIKKDSNVNPTGVNYRVNRTLGSWCTGMASPIGFGTYEVAEKMDALSGGLYRCEGKFVQVPNERQNPVAIFAINSCTEINPADLKADCPVIK